jgi:protease-4
MAEPDTETNQARPVGDDQSQKVVDRLVFAALREQTRARRWRIGFTLFFIAYLIFVTFALMTAGDDGFGIGGEPDGKKHTAVVKLSGLIASGENAGSEKMITGIRKAFEHEDTAGIVLEINSPGGSPVQASAADKIYVNKSSLVGSIGVRLDAFGFVDLMQKLGIERRLLTAGENKGLFDPFLPEQEAQKEHLQSMLDQVHGHFIDAVKQGRGDRLDQSQDIFSGLIWSGEQSLELGLADAYGSTRSVAKELQAEELVDFTPQTGLLERIADRIGSSAGRSVSQYLLGDYSIN